MAAWPRCIAGRDLRLGRDVAIKTLRTDLARDATFQLRFRREAQNAASLNHPAIVAVYDTGEERGPSGEELPYIVMEFVNGRTLKEVLAAEGRLMPRRALEITADICAALEFSHRHGIIHRDIKPGNVMLTQTGQVKVMDFGIARALASGATTMTQTSAVIGTAQYLSPEQARGEPVDARSDVYATGCVLFELLCGHPPFVGDNPVSAWPTSTSGKTRGRRARATATSPRRSTRSCSRRWPRTRSTATRAPARCVPTCMRAAAGRPVSAPPVMTEDEMATDDAGADRPTGRPPASRQPARAAQRQKRKNSTGIAVALTVLGLLAVAALSIGLYLANQAPTVPVPDLTGQDRGRGDQLRSARAASRRPTRAPTDDLHARHGHRAEPGRAKQVERGHPGRLRDLWRARGDRRSRTLVGLQPGRGEPAADGEPQPEGRRRRAGRQRCAARTRSSSANPPAGTQVDRGQLVGHAVVSKGNQAIGARP